MCPRELVEGGRIDPAGAHIGVCVCARRARQLIEERELAKQFTCLDVRKRRLVVDLGVTREFAAVDVNANYARVDHEAAVADRPGLEDAAPGSELDRDSPLDQNRRVLGRKTVERWRQACQWRLRYPSPTVPLRHVKTIPWALATEQRL